MEERRRMSLPGVSTDPESDGAVGVDHAWRWYILEKALKDAPLAASLIEAIQGMRDLDGKVDVDLLEEVVKGKREEWVDFIYSPAHTHTHTHRCSCGRRDRHMHAHKLSCTRQVQHGWKGQGLPDARADSCLTRHCLVKLPSSIAIHLTTSSHPKEGHVTHNADVRCRTSSSGRGAHSGSMGQQR